ncbi:uncharacterized protein LOC115877703 [Sitophilus oryzae]|uniref:Uncharacterized protein LOC115877703 n=1 Tax=Sitophilus oryzae TaxID=7048 RepID=A0A6J2XEZ8_SITOR|nr:uncharacterized protein LOC115877703 [Sitophilus oryzae]
MNTLRKSLKLTHNLKCLRKYSNSLYEPDYLDALKPKIPLYEALNIQVRGYDYPVLENYQKYLHNIINNMDINVEDAWAVPAQVMKITTYKPQSEVVDGQYELKTYERVIQVTDISTVQLPLLLRVIEASTPAGVTIDVAVHDEYHDKARYVPDSQLKALQQELVDLGGPSKKK